MMPKGILTSRLLNVTKKSVLHLARWIMGLIYIKIPLESLETNP